jgi:hypothetical protein
MIRIAKDTPPELIDLARRINFSSIPVSQHPAKINELKSVAERYGVPKRSDKAIPAELELNGCPQSLATLISQMDFSKYNPIIRKTAINFMENWLKKEGLLR